VAPTCQSIDPALVGSLDLEAAVVRQIDFAEALKIPGEVRLDPDRRATLASTLAGRVAVLDAPPHAMVRAGQRLAVLDLVDPGLRDLQVQAVQARAELLETRTERDRTRAYLKALQGKAGLAVAERERVRGDLAVQQARLESRQRTLKAMLQALRLAGLSAAQIRGLERNGEVVTRVALHAPVLPGRPDMEVAARPVHLGQSVSTGQALYELAALDRLLVTGEAFEADLGAVRAAARDELPVSVLFPSEDRRVDDLKIFSVEGALDGEQRLTHFFVELPNRTLGSKERAGHRFADWEHRAGARVQVSVPVGARAPRLAVPAVSLVRLEGRDWVFRWHAGHCDRVPVRIESSDGREAVLRPGAALKAGDRIVGRGALDLLLVMRRAKADELGVAIDEHAGHGH